MFTKKEWKARQTEFPNRRRLTKEGGTSELVTVSREEGQVSESGDAFSPDNMNGLEERISEGFHWINIGEYFTGQQSVAIPEGANEIFVKINVDARSIILSQCIPVEALYDTAQSFRLGYYQSSSNGSGAIFSVSKSSVALNHVYLNGSDVTSNTQWTILYR